MGFFFQADPWTTQGWTAWVFGSNCHRTVAGSVTEGDLQTRWTHYKVACGASAVGAPAPWFPHYSRVGCVCLCKTSAVFIMHTSYSTQYAENATCAPRVRHRMCLRAPLPAPPASVPPFGGRSSEQRAWGAQPRLTEGWDSPSEQGLGSPRPHHRELR